MSAGRNSRGKLCSELVEALRGTEKHNPGLEVVEEWGELVVFFNQRRLVKTQEQVAFVIKCKGCKRGQQHFRVLTLNGVRNVGEALRCWFCYGKATSSSTVPEDQVLGVLQTCKVDQEYAAQVALPCWHGRFDFYQFSKGIAINVDGSHHFTQRRSIKAPEKLVNDLFCCVKAWEGRVKLVRVHDDDTATCEWLLLGLTGHEDRIPQSILTRAEVEGVSAADVTLEGCSHFIVLTAGFKLVAWKGGQSIMAQGKNVMAYCDVLQEWLGPSAVRVPMLDGAVGFIPRA